MLEGQILLTEQQNANVFIAGDTPYPEWYSVHTAAISSAELNGTIEGVSPPFGDASVGLKKMVLIAREVVIKAINEAFRDKETILPLLRENIESSLEETSFSQIEVIDDQMKSMQQELLATVNSKNTGDELGMEIRRLRDEKQVLQNEQASRQEMKNRIDEMMRFLNNLPYELTEYEEEYVRTLLEKITVYDNHIIVEFKSGIEIQIDE